MAQDAHYGPEPTLTCFVSYDFWIQVFLGGRQSLLNLLGIDGGVESRFEGRNRRVEELQEMGKPFIRTQAIGDLVCDDDEEAEFESAVGEGF